MPDDTSSFKTTTKNPLSKFQKFVMRVEAAVLPGVEYTEET